MRWRKEHERKNKFAYFEFVWKWPIPRRVGTPFFFFFNPLLEDSSCWLPWIGIQSSMSYTIQETMCFLQHLYHYPMTNFILTMKHILHKIQYHISIDMYIKMIFLFTNKYLFKCLSCTGYFIIPPFFTFLNNTLKMSKYGTRYIKIYRFAIT